MKTDMHVHTMYSGHSLLAPKLVARVAERRGLGCLAVTDHNTIRGSVEVSKIFPTIVGEEISCDEGDLIGLYLMEEISPGPVLEVMDQIRSQGGLVMVPHPFDSLRSEALRSEELCSKGDVVEIFNSRTIRAADNARAAAFAEERGLPVVVGSDAHTSIEIGRSWIDVENVDCPESFLRSLSNAKMHTGRSPVFVHAQTKLLKLIGR